MKTFKTTKNMRFQNQVKSTIFNMVVFSLKYLHKLLKSVTKTIPKIQRFSIRITIKVRNLLILAFRSNFPALYKILGGVKPIKLPHEFVKSKVSKDQTRSRSNALTRFLRENKSSWKFLKNSNKEDSVQVVVKRGGDSKNRAAVKRSEDSKHADNQSVRVKRTAVKRIKIHDLKTKAVKHMNNQSNQSIKDHSSCLKTTNHKPTTTQIKVAQNPSKWHKTPRKQATRKGYAAPGRSIKWYSNLNVASQHAILLISLVFLTAVWIVAEEINKPLHATYSTDYVVSDLTNELIFYVNQDGTGYISMSFQEAEKHLLASGKRDLLPYLYMLAKCNQCLIKP